MTKFIEIHAIHSVPPSNLNRDDNGSPKSAIVGGVKRHRVSSQSWKKAIRDYFKENNDIKSIGYRTKNIGTLLANKIQELDPSIERELAISNAVFAMKALGIIGKTKAKEEEIITADALFLISDAQIESVAKILIEYGENVKTKDLKESLINHNSLDLALFGRMVASTPDLNIEAAAQFAHAFSTHEINSEFDFFTAVDDFNVSDHAGAGMMGEIEFTSSTLYRYAVVNVDALSAQFGENNSEILADGVLRFIDAFIKSMPSGKQNSFAALTLPEAVLINITDKQPISYANAFEKPVRGGLEGYSRASIQELVSAIKNTNSVYGETENSSYSFALQEEDKENLSQVSKVGTLKETLDSIKENLTSSEEQ